MAGSLTSGFHRRPIINHSSLWDDRGAVYLLDLAGQARILSPEYDSTDGLAWTLDGKEIWCNAARSGYPRSLLAVNPQGKHSRRSGDSFGDDIARFCAGWPGAREPGLRRSRHGNFGA